ncbi:MAG: hypothetical protein P8X82_10855 [Gemmatimonadales bacterium]|jgi:hypothetical protein
MDLMSTAQLLGNFGEFLGAIAVVATLGYLSRQIRSSNKAQRTATQHDILTEFRSDMRCVLTDDELYEGFRRFSLGEDMDRAARFKVSLHIGNEFRIYEELYLAYLDGNVSEDLWSARMRTLQTFYLSRPLTQRWWRNTGTTVASKPFADLVEGLIGEATDQPA